MGHKHSIIDCADKRNGFSGNDCMDSPELMLCACFKILKDFVEREQPFKYCYQPDSDKPSIEEARATSDGDSDETASKTLEILVKNWENGRTLKELYNWWTVERPKAYEVITKHYHNRKFELAICAEDSLESKDREMLNKLISIREYLWT